MCAVVNALTAAFISVLQEREGGAKDLEASLEPFHEKYFEFGLDTGVKHSSRPPFQMVYRNS